MKDFRQSPGLTREADALELLHAYRTPIILAVFFALVTARIYLHATSQRETLVALPKIYGDTKPPAAEAEEAQEKPREESARKSPSPARDAQNAPLGDKGRAE